MLRELTRTLRGLRRSRPGLARLAGLGVLVLVVGSTIAMYGGGATAARSSSVRAAAPQAATYDAAQVGVMLSRARAVESGWTQVERYYDGHVAPIERVLQDYRNDPALDRRIAVSLVREANRAGLEPRVLLAVLLVENPELNPRARSSVGAVGLMQVMPVHKGNWAACPDDLEGVDANICYGAQIFAFLYRRDGNAERALLDYNGCVHGTNTPNCRSYPYRVYASAGRASLLEWLSAGPSGAAAP